MRAFVAMIAVIGLWGCGSSPSVGQDVVLARPDVAVGVDVGTDVAAADLAGDVVAVDAGADLGVDVGHDVGADVGMDVFRTAAHAPFPLVPDQGGRVLVNPQIVTVTYADFLYRDEVEALGDFIGGSQYFAAAVGEYGVQAATQLAKVRLTDNAPDAIDDDGIKSFLLAGVMDGTLPMPPTPFNDYIYVLYFPAHTVITEVPMADSCVAFEGYHGELTMGDTHLTYAVIPTCSEAASHVPDVDGVEWTASHEIMETSTDPDALSAPAFQRVFNALDPWLYVGGELTDLCVGDFILGVEGTMLNVQRNWSNRAAMAGTAPCVPAPAGPYFNVSPDRTTAITVAAGASTDITLTGWSTAAVPDWQLVVNPNPLTFTPMTSLDTSTINNGKTAKLTVTVPAGTPSGSMASLLVYSFEMSAGFGFGYWPLLIVVP